MRTRVALQCELGLFLYITRAGFAFNYSVFGILHISKLILFVRVVSAHLGLCARAVSPHLGLSTHLGLCARVVFTHLGLFRTTLGLGLGPRSTTRIRVRVRVRVRVGTPHFWGWEPRTTA